VKRIVISQPMVFPWVGLFEQIRLADIYVHYDDVQLPLGRSFITRVQVKNVSDVQWLTLPIAPGSHLAKINESSTKETRDWRGEHVKLLTSLYSEAPYFRDMMNIVEEIYSHRDCNVAVLNARGIERVSRYFEIECTFRTSSEMSIPGRSSERLLGMVQRLNGSTYITGHGARSYLDHELFERNGVNVEYIEYQRVPYTQLYGEFTPFVSVLDLIANEGRAGRRVFVSSSIPWKEFLA
jgi:hypothetical protein